MFVCVERSKRERESGLDSAVRSEAHRRRSDLRPTIGKGKELNMYFKQKIKIYISHKGEAIS